MEDYVGKSVKVNHPVMGIYNCIVAGFDYEKGCTLVKEENPDELRWGKWFFSGRIKGHV